MSTTQSIPLTAVTTGVQLASLDEDGRVNWDKAYEAVLSFSHAGFGSAGAPMLCITNKSTGTVVLQTLLNSKSVWRANQCLFFINPAPGHQANTACFAVRCSSQQVADSIQQALESSLAVSSSHSQQPQQGQAGPSTPSGPGAAGGGQAAATTLSIFDKKIDKSSADMYFSYYGMIMHQQNMLQDYVRTGTYYMAIVENRTDFEGLAVMDVGAGSGILSLFAAQAGARKVYAVEASGMAKFAAQLKDANPALGSRIEVVNGKVEEVRIPEKVDVLISEPMGTLLVNERMLESYIYARDRFLKPGGKMFPQLGRVHVAAFSDEVLFNEVLAKAQFWVQPNFYGVDVTSLYNSAVDSYFAQVVVDAFDQSVLVSTCATKIFDFATMTEPSLYDILIPLQLQVTSPGPTTIHGVACWFDVFFNGALNPTWLSTAPGLPTTHWFQLRCVLKVPIYVAGPTTLTGHLRLVAHSRQSYDIHLTMHGPPLQPHQPPQTSSGSYDLKEPYYRQLNMASWYQPAGNTTGSGNAPSGGIDAHGNNV